MVMGFGVLSVQYHNFQIFQQKNNVVLAKCNCCNPPRWGVFVADGKDRNFYYHGHDSKYAQNLFSQLINSQQFQ